MNVRRIVYHLFIAIICVAIVSPFVFLFGDRSSPYMYIRGYIDHEQFMPGDKIDVHWSGIYRRDCPGQIFRSVTDAAKAVHLLEVIPDPVGDDPVGIEVEWTRSFILPLAVAEGRSIYRAHAEYWCSPIQRWWPIKVSPPDISFNVVRPLEAVAPNPLRLPQQVK